MSEPPDRREPGGESPERRESTGTLSSEDVQAIARTWELNAEIRFRELHVQAEWNKHNFDYANRALEFQEKDLGNARKHRTLVVLALAALLFAFLVFSTYTGNQEFAYDLIKVGMGAVGGYGVALWRTQAASRQDR